MWDDGSWRRRRPAETKNYTVDRHRHRRRRRRCRRRRIPTLLIYSRAGPVTRRRCVAYAVVIITKGEKTCVRSSGSRLTNILEMCFYETFQTTGPRDNHVADDDSRGFFYRRNNVFLYIFRKFSSNSFPAQNSPHTHPAPRVKTTSRRLVRKVRRPVGRTHHTHTHTRAVGFLLETRR